MQNHVLLSQGGVVGAGMLQLWEGKVRRAELGRRAKGGHRGLADLLLSLPGGQGATAACFDLSLQQQLGLPVGPAQAEQAAWPRSLCCPGQWPCLPFSQAPCLQPLPGLQANGGQPLPAHQEWWHCHLPGGM